jgi:type VI secretion system protein ImpL
MRWSLSLVVGVAWIAVAISPAAAQDDAQTCTQATGDDAIAACRRLLDASVTKDCQQIIVGKYPFVRSGADVPLEGFARLFGPSGAIDRFFKDYLAVHVDTTGPQWTWRPGRADLLPAAILLAFQNAAWIRGAFFPNGSGPTVTLTVATNPATATFESGGTTIVHPSSQIVKWPGSAMRTMIRFNPAGGPPVSIGRDGPWSLFRMLEIGGLRPRGQMASAMYLIAGQELRYEITVMSGSNPLDLARLRQFQCPAGS